MDELGYSQRRKLISQKIHEHWKQDSAQQATKVIEIVQLHCCHLNSISILSHKNRQESQQEKAINNGYQL